MMYAEDLLDVKQAVIDIGANGDGVFYTDLTKRMLIKFPSNTTQAMISEFSDESLYGDRMFSLEDGEILYKFFYSEYFADFCYLNWDRITLIYEELEL